MASRGVPRPKYATFPVKRFRRELRAVKARARMAGTPMSRKDAWNTAAQFFGMVSE